MGTKLVCEGSPLCTLVHNKLKPKNGTLPPNIPYFAGEEIPDKWCTYQLFLISRIGADYTCLHQSTILGSNSERPRDILIYRTADLKAFLLSDIYEHDKLANAQQK